jgi:hypothetical protein
VIKKEQVPMNVMFGFSDPHKQENYSIKDWKGYNSPFLPGVGDRVWIAVYKGEEVSDKRKYCKVVERSFYPDGDVFMEVLWGD